MENKIICNNCNQEVDCFERVCEGTIHDTWVLNRDGKYEYVQFEEAEAEDMIKIICNNCKQEINEEISDKIFDNME